MVRKLIVSSIVALSFAAPAAAENLCVRRDDVLRHLERKFEEGPIAMGLASNGAVLEVLTSKSESRTLILTHHTGTSCVIASGEAWSATAGRTLSTSS